eukprot:3298386-Amphidinium_carterae.1
MVDYLACSEPVVSRLSDLQVGWDMRPLGVWTRSCRSTVSQMMRHLPHCWGFGMLWPPTPN